MFRSVYKGRFFTVERGSARVRKRAVVFERIASPDAVAVLPFIDSKTILMEKQYRFQIESWLLEIPAGTIEKAESPRHAALRELREETGYTASELQHLFNSFASPGRSTELTRYYAAYGLVKGSTEQDKSEVITTVELGLDEALGMIKRNRIRDTKSIACLLYYKAYGIGKVLSKQALPTTP